MGGRFSRLVLLEERRGMVQLGTRGWSPSTRGKNKMTTKHVKQLALHVEKIVFHTRGIHVLVC